MAVTLEDLAVFQPTLPVGGATAKITKKGEGIFA